MTDRRRPPDHPLVEMLHELRDGIENATIRPTTGEGGALFGHLRAAVQAARNVVDSLDLALVELEHRSRHTPIPEDGGNDDVPIHHIEIL